VTNLSRNIDIDRICNIVIYKVVLRKYHGAETRTCTKKTISSWDGIPESNNEKNQERFGNT
jgi:hypothetical protein